MYLSLNQKKFILQNLHLIKKFQPEILFYVAFGSYFIATLVGYLAFDYDKECRMFFTLFTIVSLVTYIIVSKKIAELSIIQAFFLLFFFIVSLYSNDFYMLVLVLMFISMNDISITVIFLISYYLLFIISIFVVVTSLVFDLFSDVQDTRASVYGYGIIRHSLGFRWSFCLPDISVYLFVYLSIFKRHFKFRSFLFFQIISIILFVLCNSKNALIAIEMLFLLLYISNLFDTKRYIKTIFSLSIIVFPSIALISTLLLHFYVDGYEFANVIDSFLSGRLYLVKLNAAMSPPVFFNTMSFDDFMLNCPFTTDSGYYYLLLRYGWWSLVLFTFISYKNFLFFFKVNNKYGIICFFIILLMSFIDNNFACFAFLPFYMVCFYIIKRKSKLLSVHNYGENTI